jgi:hypothetical protein
VWDLLFRAKHLFVAAIAWQRCDLRRRCTVGGGHELPEEKGPGRVLGGKPGQGLSWQSRSKSALLALRLWEKTVGGDPFFSLTP